MSQRHLDSKELRRLAAGDLSQQETTRVSLHLLVCPQCRKALGEIATEAAELLKLLLRDLLEEPVGDAMGAAVTGLSRRGAETSADAGPRSASPTTPAASSTVADLLGELRELPAPRRLERIREDPRFHSVRLVEALLEEAESSLSQDPLVSEDLSHCALEVMRSVGSEIEDRPEAYDLRAQAWIHIANAQRIRSDWACAHNAFETAETLLGQGRRDPLLRAELLYRKSILLREQRRFEESEKVIDQAIAIYRWAGNDRGLCRCLIIKARIFEYRDDPERSIPLLGEAADLVSEEDDAYLLPGIWQNLALCLVKAGEPEEARELLPAIHKRCSELGPHYQIRIRWLEALIARDLGEHDEAERILRQVREKFIHDGIGIDAALASLDLASMLLEQGRTSETRQLAEEMLPIFDSLDIRREAFASLILFQQAALREEATVQMVQEIAACLRRASAQPALRYENPS